MRRAFWMDRNWTTTAGTRQQKSDALNAVCMHFWLFRLQGGERTWWLPFLRCFNFWNSVDCDSLRAYYSELVWRLREVVIVHRHRELFHVTGHKRVDPHHKQLGIFCYLLHLQHDSFIEDKSENNVGVDIIRGRERLTVAWIDRRIASVVLEDTHESPIIWQFLLTLVTIAIWHTNKLGTTQATSSALTKR